MVRQSALAAAWVALAVSSGQRGFAQEAKSAADPRAVLAEHGLTAAGESWLLADEVELRRWLDALDPIERQYQTLQAAVDHDVKQNESARRELSAKRRELKSIQEKLTKATPSSINPTLDQLEKNQSDALKRIEQLSREYKRPDRFAELPAVRENVIRLANARAGLTMAAAKVRRLSDRLGGEYQRLGETADVKAALESLGPPHRLGSGKDLPGEAARKLSKIDRALDSAIVPAYREDNHARIVAVVDGATPVTFSLRQSDGPTVLPHSIVSSLGIALENAPAVEYVPAPGRRLACRRIKLAVVQVGNLELRDVTAIALPPEGEDLGAKLGKSAYAGQYLDVDFARLRLTVLRNAPPEASKGLPAPPAGKTPIRSRPRPR